MTGLNSQNANRNSMRGVKKTKEKQRKTKYAPQAQKFPAKNTISRDPLNAWWSILQDISSTVIVSFIFLAVKNRRSKKLDFNGEKTERKNNPENWTFLKLDTMCLFTQKTQKYFYWGYFNDRHSPFFFSQKKKTRKIPFPKTVDFVEFLFFFSKIKNPTITASEKLQYFIKKHSSWFYRIADNCWQGGGG